jgi:predicted neutral ceramidase superfamily lipid hydrolase
MTESSTGSNYRLLPLYSLCFGIGIYLSKSFKSSRSYFNVSILIITVISFIIGGFDLRFYKIAVILLLLLLALSISIRFTFLQRSFHGSGGVYLLHTPVLNFAISTGLLLIGVKACPNLFLSWISTYILCLLMTHIFIRLFPSKKWILLE